MIDPSEDDIAKRLSTFVSSAALCSILIGLSVVAGWTLSLPILLTWGAPTTMAPNAAVCCVLAGLSLWLLRKTNDAPVAGSGRIVAKAAAAIIALAGILTLVEQLFDLNLGIDGIFVGKAQALAIAGARIRMSPIAAIIFLLLGLALLLIDWRTRRNDWPAQLLSFGAAMGAAFGLFGLVFAPGVSPITLALPADVAYFLLAFGIVCARASWAAGGLLTSDKQGARFLRKVVPTALLILALIGWLISKPLLTESHFTWIEVGALALLCSAILVCFIAWIAFVLDRGDIERKKLEQALHLGNKQMGQLLEEPQVEGELRTKIRAGFSLAIILTCLLSFLSWRIAQQAADDAAWVAHTHEVSTELEATLRHLVDVETGGRGFALTGRQAFLEPYETGKYGVAQELQNLHLSIVDSDQQRRLDTLQKQANVTIEAAGNVVTLRQNTGQPPTEVQLERGKQLMDAARLTIAEMEDSERRLLEQRTERARAAQRLNLTLIALGALAGVIFLCVAGVTVSREIGISAIARAQTLALNADLENRVQRRTAALQSEVANRQAAEAKLRASEEMFRVLLDGIKDYAVYMLDDEGRVASWNSGAARIKGYSAEEIIGKHVSCFYTEADREQSVPQATLREAASSGRFEAEGWRVRKNGSRFWADAVITPLFDANGSLRGYSKVVRDITDRRQAEEELQRQAALLDLAHDAIFVRDLQSKVVFWNRGAQRLYGWTAGEARGRITHELLQTKFPVPLSEIDAELARMGDWEGELRHTTHFGAEVVVASRWSLQRDQNGLPSRILEINRDITDRKQAEEELQRQAALLDLAHDAILVRDLQSKVIFWSRGAQHLYGWSAGEASGHITHELLRTKFPVPLSEIEAALASKGDWEGELRHTTLFGSEVVVASRWSLQRDQNGLPSRILEINRDITDRKQAEEALRETEGRVAGILQSAMDSIITVDEEQRIVLFNNAAERVFLCPAAEAIGKPITRFIPQRFQASHAEHIYKFGETGITSRAMGLKNVLWAVRADGQEFPIEASISQVFTGGRKLFTVILRDVTERAQADATRERLAAIVESSDDAIISKTLDGTITAWNHGAEKVFGYPSSEAVGKKMWMIIPTERSHEEIEILERIGRGESVEHFETVRTRKDGRQIDVSVTISPIRDNKGTVVAASKIARDITERKRVEAALREQAKVLDLGQVMVRDMKGSITLWTRGTEQLYGYSPEEALGRVSHELLQTQFPEPLEQIEKQLERSGAWEGELIHRRRDGHQITVASVWVLHRDATIGTGRILESNTDITQIKRAEQALRESEERLRLAVDGAGLGTWNWDLKTGELFGSPRAFALFGLPADTKFDFDIFLATLHPDDRVKVNEAMQRTLDGEVEYDVEYRCIWPDRTERWIAAKGRLYRNDAGGAVRVGGIVFDVTERRRAVQALETERLMLQAVLDSMVEGLVAADEQGKFIIWNPAATKIVGLDAASVPPEEWGAYYRAYLPDMITPFPTDQNPLVRAIRGEVSSAEIYIRNPELNQGVWIDSHGAPLRDKNGNLRGGVVAFRDITQKKAAELEIRKLNETLEERIAQRTAQLEATNRELESFTYSVSHDLRAPLRHIQGFAGACVEEFGATVDPQALHYLQRIQDGTHRMGVLVDELLNLARTGQRPLRLQLTALNSIVEETITILKTETEGREVEWKIGSLPSVECDPVLVRQIFQNLLSNAIKYSRRRPHAVIEVGHIQEKNQPIVFVRDNGAGFNMKYADKLFGVFQRLHREEEFEGTGVGLATVHRIVQKHGGRIWAEAEPDRGATFYFTLGGNQVAGSRSNAAAAGPSS